VHYDIIIHEKQRLHHYCLQCTEEDPGLQIESFSSQRNKTAFFTKQNKTLNDINRMQHTWRTCKSVIISITTTTYTVILPCTVALDPAGAALLRYDTDADHTSA
jgi:hypothetical protein